MPLITIILFFTFLGLLFLLSIFLKNKKKLNAAKKYGEKECGINLPSEAYIYEQGKKYNLPVFSQLSDAEAFFQLITPYIGSMPTEKRENLYKQVSSLKDSLKLNKDIFRYFNEEYKLYEGLSDEQAAEKWAEK